MVGESKQNVFLIQIDASSFAEFEISKFEISRFDSNWFKIIYAYSLTKHEYDHNPIQLLNYQVHSAYIKLQENITNIYFSSNY